MRKVVLEALAAWLALAAVSGQTCAAMQKTGAHSVSAMAFRGNRVSIADDTDAAVSLVEVAANGSTPANADVALLTSAATDRSGNRTRLTTGVHTPASSSFRSVDALHFLNAAPGFSLSVADDFTPARKNVHVAALRRRAFDRRDVAGASQVGVLVPAYAGSSRIEAIRTVRDEDSDAATVSLLPGLKPVPEKVVAVPEPGSWATALAGLLCAIAIARRRMSQ